MNIITNPFDKAASTYDHATPVQAQVAQRLVSRAAPQPMQSPHILDLGCGTGFVAEAAVKRWPMAAVTALDQSAAMLQQAQTKIPGLQTILGDASRIQMDQKFDVIFSSMMLHWLPNPYEALRRWQGWLKPQGRLYVALLTEGTFQEWRDLCLTANIVDGLWPMPRVDFANMLLSNLEQQSIEVSYTSAHEFLRRLKIIGATTPRPDHTPLSAPILRRLLKKAPQPFIATYRVLYIEIQSLDSI